MKPTPVTRRLLLVMMLLAAAGLSGCSRSRTRWMDAANPGDRTDEMDALSPGTVQEGPLMDEEVEQVLDDLDAALEDLDALLGETGDWDVELP